MGESEDTGQVPQSEEELRARIEEGLRQMRVQDVVLESVVTIVNLTARRIGKDDERDLEQARVGIDAVRGLVDLLEPEARNQVREALASLQMSFARAAGEEAPGDGGEDEPEAPPAASEPAADAESEEGPHRPPPGLWVPPGSA